MPHLSDPMYKNVHFWISDVLESYKEPLPSVIKSDHSAEKIKYQNIDLSAIKTLSVVGVVVGVRNETSASSMPDNFNSANCQEYTRPIVYGK